MEFYEQRFSGISRVYGSQGLAKFRQSHVAVIGLGGVGSWSAEALARSGIGRLTLIDLDEICISNTNRQLHTLQETIGRSKVTVMAERLRSINPGLVVHETNDFFTASTAAGILAQDFDLVIDAIDSLHNKCLLIAECVRRSIAIVSVGGAGGRRDPTAIQQADLAQSQGDALFRQVRRRLRQEHGFPATGVFGVKAIYSTENPVFPGADGSVGDAAALRSGRLGGCELGYGATSFVTGSFGFAAAAAGLNLLLASSIDP